jgi:hypothetical protein
VEILNSEFRIPNSPPYTLTVDNFLSPPLARWDGLHLALDLRLVGHYLNHLLAQRDGLRDLTLRGRGDALAAEVTLVWKGVPARIGLELAEIRLRHQHIGFRMRRLRALGGIPVPRSAVELTLKALSNSLVSVFSGQGILVVDLVLDILTVQGTTRTLHVWFGAGSLANLPGKGPRLLPPEGG